MASYEIDAYGARAKVRDIGIVILLTVVTLGFYVWVWYYRINRELRDFGVVYKDEELAKTKPWLSILATTLGALLIVPAIVSYWRTTGRIRRAQQITQTPLTDGWVIFAIYVAGFFFFLPYIGIPVYVQSGLNKMWERYPNADGTAQIQQAAPATDLATAAQEGRNPLVRED